MRNHEDEFCPGCGQNLGLGTIAVMGCPLCGYSEDDDADSVSGGDKDEEE